jgi:hypothetical protein
VRGTADARAPGLGTRLFVYGFLALFALCAARSIEWWPLTGWRLFSHVRTGTAYGWEVVTVDDAGAEHPLPIAALPRGYHGVLQVAGAFPRLPQATRDDICRAWASGVEALGQPVTDVRVYRTRSRVRTDFDRPPPTAERTARFDCAVT